MMLESGSHQENAAAVAASPKGIKPQLCKRCLEHGTRYPGLFRAKQQLALCSTCYRFAWGISGDEPTDEPEVRESKKLPKGRLNSESSFEDEATLPQVTVAMREETESDDQDQDLETAVPYHEHRV